MNDPPQGPGKTRQPPRSQQREIIKIRAQTDDTETNKKTKNQWDKNWVFENIDKPLAKPTKREDLS